MKIDNNSKAVISLFVIILFSTQWMMAQLGNIGKEQVMGGDKFGDNFILSYGVNIGVGTLPSNRNNFTFIDIAVLLNGRYNLYVVNTNSAFGIDFAPQIGSYANGSLANYFGFSLPVMVSHNFGLGSTYDSDKRFGLGIKAGIQLDVGPLVGERVPNFTPLIVYPVAQLDVRFWKRGKSNPRDLYIKYGYISNERDGTNFILAVGGLYMVH